MNLTEITTRRAQELFSNTDSSAEPEEISVIADLQGVNQEVVAKLREAGYEDIEKFAVAYENGELDNLEGLTAEELAEVNKIVHNSVEFVEEEDSEPAPSENENTSEEEEEYFCPECGAKITLDMTRCPSCGVEFEFEEDEE